MKLNDLSQEHKPISNLFPTVADESAFRLSAAQLEQFRTDGFLSGIRVLDDQQIDALRNELESFHREEIADSDLWYEYNSNESSDPDTVLFHALGAWRLGAGFHDLLWHQAFTVPASQLLEGPVRFWHDQLFSKPALHGGVVAWHQDYSYWTTHGPSHLLDRPG